MKAGIIGSPQGIIRNKSLFIPGKFLSKLCSCLSHKEVMLVSVSVLMSWNSLLFVESIWRGLKKKITQNSLHKFSLKMACPSSISSSSALLTGLFLHSSVFGF